MEGVNVAMEDPVNVTELKKADEVQLLPARQGNACVGSMSNGAAN